MTSFSEEGNSVSYTGYNAAGAVMSSTQTNGSNSYPFTYAYNPAGTLSQEGYPAGRQLSYWYSAMNRPQALGGTLTDAQGNTTSTTYLNWTGYQGSHEVSRSLGSLYGIVTGIDYNSRGQVSDLRVMDWNHGDNSPNYVQFYDGYYYGWSNNNGNLLSVTSYNSPSLQSSPWEQRSPGITTSYTYDGVNRLSSVTDSSYARTMCYDAYGNGWVTSYSGTTPVPGNAPQELGASCPASGSATPYNASNRLTAESYDGNGNQTTNSGNTVSYDAENRITSVSNGANVLVSYQYDGDGKRISKTSSAGTTNYVYDATGRLIAEYVNGSLSKEYIRTYSQFTPSNMDLLAIENAPGTSEPCMTCFVVSDTLGSIRIMADNTGAAISRHDYLPFGEEAQPDTNRPATAGFFGADGATQRFTGKERDSESGLDYFGARYYGSALGRFTSPDWSETPQPVPYASLDNPQSLNLYTYGANNPLSNTDADGHCWVIFRFSEHVCNATDGLGWVSNEKAEEEVKNYRSQLTDAQVTRNGENIDWSKATPKEVNDAHNALERTNELVMAMAAGKPVNLPSAKSVEIDMDHVTSGHTEGGSRVGPGSRKDLFPKDWSDAKIEKAIREAYQNSKKISGFDSTGRIQLEGTGGGRTIQMYLNTATKTIESAWPK